MVYLSRPISIDSVTVDAAVLVVTPSGGTDGITVESTDDLASGMWQTNSTPPATNGVFRLPTTGNADYYRLTPAPLTAPGMSWRKWVGGGQVCASPDIARRG